MLKGDDKLYGFVTTKGIVVDRYMLEEMGIKSIPLENSDEIDTSSEYQSHNVIARLYQLRALAKWYPVSAVFRKAIERKVNDILSGYSIVPKNDTNNPDKEPNPAHKKIIEDFLNNMPIDVLDVKKKTETDYQVFGENFTEYVREDKDPKKNIAYINHIQIQYLNMLKGAEVAEMFSGNTYSYFKEYELEDNIDRKTGRKLGSSSPNKANKEGHNANEFVRELVIDVESQYYGLSPLVSVYMNILGNFFAQCYNNSKFENMGVPAYMLSVTGNYNPGPKDETNKTALRRSLEAQVKKFAENPNSIMITTVEARDGDPSSKVEVKWHKIDDDIKDGSYLEFIKENDTKLYTITGVPSYLLANNSETGPLGGTNAESAFFTYNLTEVQPRQKAINREINTLLFNNFGELDYMFKLDVLDIDTTSQDLDIALKLFEGAAMTVGQLIDNFGAKFGIKRDKSKYMDIRVLGPKRNVINSDELGIVTDEDLKKEKSEKTKYLVDSFRNMATKED